jgi:hypothetical protein
MYRMSRVVKKNFNAPDEVRQFANAKVEIVNLGDFQVMRTLLQPGWRWSESVKPIVGIESCQVYHLTFVISRRVVVRVDDGSTTEFGPGVVAVLPPGYDAWTVGYEPVMGIDYEHGATYAKLNSS